MSASTNNIDLVSQQELNRLVKYNEELIKSKNNLGGMIPVLRNASIGMETYAGDYKTLMQMVKSFEKIQKDAKKTVEEYGRSVDALVAAQKSYVKVISDVGRQTAVLVEQMRQQNTVTKQAAEEMQALEKVVSQYRTTLNELKSEAADMDVGSEAFAKATAEIDALNVKIMQLEEILNSNLRNVDDYSSAFENLNSQIQQVARTLPSLAISPGTFFKDILNALPNLVDAYRKVVAENNKLREANKLLASDQQTQVVPAWKQLLSSVFSWQTALTAGATLLAVHGDKIVAWVTELFNGRDALKQVREAEQDLTTEVSSQIGQLDVLLERFRNAKSGTEEYITAKNALVSQYGDYIPNMESELANLTNELDLRNKLVTAIYKEAQAKKQAEALTNVQNEYFETVQEQLGKRSMTKAFEELYGDRAAEMQNVVIMGMIGDTEQQAMAEEILDAVEVANPIHLGTGTYYRNAFKVDNIKNAASEYLTQVDAISQMGEEFEEALELLNGSGSTGDDSAPVTLQALRAKLSELEKNATLIDKNDTAAIEANKSERKAVESEIAEMEKRLGFGGSSESSSGGGSYSISEKRQTEIELEKKQLEDAAAAQKAIYENEENSYAERIEALDEYYAKRGELVNQAYDVDKEELDAKLSAGDIDADTYNAVLAQIEYARDSALTQLQSERKEAEDGIAKSVANTMIKQIETKATSVSGELKAAADAEMVGLSEQYANGLIDKEEYEKRKAEIAAKYCQQEFENEVQMLQEMLALENLSAEDQAAIAKKLADVQVEYNKQKNDEIIADNENAGNENTALAEQETQLKKQLLDEVFSFVGTLNDARLERENERLDKESEANDEWKEQEIERIESLEEQGVISKEQAEDKKQQIEDQAAANEEEIEKKRIDAQREAAIYSKLISATQIGINTATGIVKTIAEVGMPAAIPLIALTSAIGAVQLANVLAEPIPEYAHGTKDHHGGLAVVGDGGRPEMVVFPDGSIWRTPAVDTLVNLPEHTQVLPDYHAALNSFVSVSANALPASVVDMSGVIRKLDQTSDRISETNRLFRVSIARADKRSKTQNALLLNRNTHKLWN